MLLNDCTDTLAICGKPAGYKMLTPLQLLETTLTDNCNYIVHFATITSSCKHVLLLLMITLNQKEKKDGLQDNLLSFLL